MSSVASVEVEAVEFTTSELPFNKQIALDKCVMRELLLLDTQI
jgi:hypothetical protein